MTREQKRAVRDAIIALLKNGSYGPTQGPLLSAQVDLRRAFALPMRHSQTNAAVGRFIALYDEE